MPSWCLLSPSGTVAKSTAELLDGAAKAAHEHIAVRVGPRGGRVSCRLGASQRTSQGGASRQGGHERGLPRGAWALWAGQPTARRVASRAREQSEHIQYLDLVTGSLDGVIGAYMSPGIFLASKAYGAAGEEFFAPLLVVEIVDDDAAAVAALNATPYGLAAGVFCASEDRFERLAAELDVGICNWNRGTVGSSSKLPFGGVKASGNHRPAGLASTLYCVDAVAQIRWPEPPPPAALPGFPL